MFGNESTNKRNDYRPTSRHCTKCGSVVDSEDLFCQSCGSELAVRKASSAYVAKSPRLESFRGYIQIIGVVEIVFGVFALIVGVILTLVAPLLYMVFRSGIALELDVENSAVLLKIAPFLALLLFGIALLCFVYAFVSILSGKRLLNYENSGRIGTMVIGALNLFNIPFGTVFGIAALYVLSQPEVEQLYTQK